MRRSCKSLTFANPCTIDNVAHTLTVTLDSKSISRTVNVYQSAYLVVRSKTNGTEKQNLENGVTITFNNELVANFYYSPILMSGSMVEMPYLNLRYKYNDSGYLEDSYPGIYEDISYTFIDGEMYTYFDGSTFVYHKSSNNYPHGVTVFYRGYADYADKWQPGNDGKLYYIIERQFQGGLSQDNGSHFEKVFELAYPR